MGAGPALYSTYLSAFNEVAAFYAHDFSNSDDRAHASEQAAAHPRDRARLVEILLDQNARWGLDEWTREHILQLGGPESVAVVTGQQLGLLCGPLYTIYKTLTAIQLARQTTQETGRPCVPIFWLEGEDHDFEEVASVTLVRENAPWSVTYEPTAPRLPGPVGSIVLDDGILAVLEDIDAALPDTEFKPALMEAVREAYRPGVTMLDAFARLLRTLLPETGLVLIDPSDPRLKQLVAPLFRREIMEYEASARALASATERLALQFHAQVRVHPTNLFIVTDEGRFALDVDGEGQFRLRQSGRQVTRDQLLRDLEEHPERFSPNVVLRPLMQDYLLPTAAYVAGPGEISYFGQYRPVYEWADIPMPVIYPRASATLIESRIARVLERYALGPQDLGADFEALFARIVVQEGGEGASGALDEAESQIAAAIDSLKPHIEAVDRSLGGATEAARTAILKELGRLRDRALKAEKRRHEDTRNQLVRAREALYPGGKPQERVYSVFQFLNKYGPDLLARLLSELSLDTTRHQTLYL